MLKSLGAKDGSFGGWNGVDFGDDKEILGERDIGGMGGWNRREGWSVENEVVVERNELLWLMVGRD